MPTEDRRRVRTAVTGHAASEEPSYMPTDPDEAEEFRTQARQDGQTHWCGLLLGGCGGQLSLKVIHQRETVPHFAHRADSNLCARMAQGREHIRGGQSADHLYARRHLRTWMREHLGTGAAVEAPPTFVGLDAGRGCTELIVPTSHKPLRLVFTSDLDHDLVALAKSPQARQYVWLVRANQSVTQALVANGVPHRLFQMKEDAHHERALQVGFRDGSGEVEWVPLAECVLRGDTLARARPAGRRPLASAPRESVVSDAAQAPDPLEQAVASLRQVLAQGDVANVRSLAEVVRRRLTQQGVHSLPPDLVTDARAVLREAAQALPQRAKTITVQRRVPVVEPYRRTSRPQDPLRDDIERHIGKLVWAEANGRSRAYEDNRAALVELFNRPDTPRDLVDRIRQQLRVFPKDRFRRSAPAPRTPAPERRSRQGRQAGSSRQRGPARREVRQHALLREALETLRWAQESKRADTYALTRTQLVQALERPGLPPGLREQIEAQLLRSPQGLFDRPIPAPGPRPAASSGAARPSQGSSKPRQGRGRGERDTTRRRDPAPSAKAEGGLLATARMDERSRALLEQMRQAQPGAARPDREQPTG
ncbi:hypothetical protein [Nocardiopsis synnemataformans]|uniref:hypothetical protein n=1 Tax=Nocardiopsis synnemataformans TaxID=61305 RepID=UPI003EBF875A